MKGVEWCDENKGVRRVVRAPSPNRRGVSATERRSRSTSVPTTGSARLSVGCGGVAVDNTGGGGPDTEGRCSTIKVRPKFSEAPHLSSSIPHPKTDFSKSQIASRRIIPWSESRKRFFSKSRLAFRRFGLKEARLSETKERKCYLYRRTGQGFP